MERGHVRELLAEEPYRIACPRGHTALTLAATTDTVQCGSCRQAYALDELVDKLEDQLTGGVR